MRLAISFSVTAVLLLATASAQAAIKGSADISGSLVSANTYQYNLTLHNTGDTNIVTFWYAWDDSNLNFLPSLPNNILAPNGWTGFYTYNYTPTTNYTYGIEWYNYAGNPLASGTSLNGFSFQSPDTPATLASISNVPTLNGDPAFAVGQSFVYTAYPAPPAGDPGFQFVTSPSPEPTTLGVFALTVSTALLQRRRGIARILA